MSYFIIEKSTTGNFYHIYNNERTRVNVSDFDIVLDDVSLTFIIQCKNGSNIPSQAISISLIQVIDLSVSGTPIAFSGIDGLIELLKSISYTPYLNTQAITEPIVIYKKGQVGIFKVTQTWIDDNFDSTGLGILEALGWAKRNENNGTKNQEGKFSLNQGDVPYNVIGAIGGEANHMLTLPELPTNNKNVHSAFGGITAGGGTGNQPWFPTTQNFGGSDVPHNNMPPYLIDLWLERVTDLIFYGGSGSGVQSVVAGTNITVDNTDPLNPIISSTGGGGSQTLEQTLILGPRTGGRNIIIDDTDAVELSNGSLLKKGTYDFGGTGGISRICSVGFEDMWQSGIHHVFDNNGFIRHSTNCFDVIPDNTYDDRLRFKIGSLWTLDDGTTYVCTDATHNFAVWEIYTANIPNLTQVLTKGDRVFEGINDNDYTFQGIDIARFLIQQNNTGVPIFTIDGNNDNDFSENCVLKFQSYLLPSQLHAINGAQIYVKGEGNSITLYDFNIGDYCELKKIGINKGWFLNVSNKQENSDWNATSGVAEILNKPSIPTNTSDLINDGDDGISHFITLNDLPSNIIVYPTTVASDISTYFKLVSSITDPSYNTTAVDVSTGAITTTDQLISSLATSTNFIVGNPGVFNITTIGNISKVSGSGEAEFYFRVYKRTLAGTETLIVQSSNTIPVTNTGYSEFSATGLWNDGAFLSTDRIVIKYYANRIAGGSNPTYQFQFGGITPVRTLLPIPLTVVPTLSLDGLSDVTIATVANEDFLQYESSTSLWKNIQLTATWIRSKLGITTLSGSNTGDETTATIKTKLGITTLSGSNTGDQDLSTYATLANTPAVILNDNRTSSAVTGTTTITVINSYLAPANTFAAFDRLQLDFLGLKTTTLGAGTYTVNINTTNSLSGSTKIAGFTISAASKFLLGQRHLAFKSATTFEIFTTGLNNAYDIGTDTNLPTTITYDTTQAYYIITTITPALTTDSFTQSRFAITRSKSKNTI